MVVQQLRNQASSHGYKVKVEVTDEGVNVLAVKRT